MLGFLCTRPTLRRGLSFDTRSNLGIHVLFFACYFRLYFSDKDRLTRLTSKE